MMITPKMAAAYDTARSFETMSLQQLRQAWCNRYGKPHPPMRSPRLLAHLLAWRVQADVMGGLDKKTRTAVQGTSKPKAPGPVLTAGVRISREWRGRVCDVEVVADGFLFEGKAYASLSEIASTITGVRWNGPRFFGLRKAVAR